ncbi:MAG: hypothetical protein BIFFINMI_02976 [Phycisphaerae bacterium]|nr:hypothetical protein [Phycisphaerae bacterium]
MRLASIQSGPSIPRRTGAFTLVELMIAVGLLAMIFVVAGYIFQTSVSAISKAEANNEMVMSLTAFSKQCRYDMQAIEHNGFLVIGRRQQDAFASTADESENIKRTFRNDWMMFTMTTEQPSVVDPRVIGQWERIFYGQGDVTNPSNSQYSKYATDWVLMRHQILMMPKLRISTSEMEAAMKDYTTWTTVAGIDWNDSPDYLGKERQFWTAMQSYTYRKLYWFWMMNYGWCGSYPMPWAYARGGGQDSTAKTYFEPTYWQDASFYFGASAGRRFQLLGHCGDFKVQYAMSEDLGSTIAWRNPPAVGDSSNPQDPSYNASDPVNSDRTNQDGRLMFGPGDRWPSLLKIHVHIYDPLNRLVDGRAMDIVVPMN